MENKYQQRVREIAEEMAKDSITSMHVNGDYEVGRKVAAAFYLVSARIAVKYMAAMFATAFLMNYEIIPDDDGKEECNREMIKRGLIAPPENSENGK